MYERLLVPVDGTDLSDRAIREGLALARQLGAAVVGFVVEPPAPLPVVGTHPTLYAREAEEHDSRTAAHAHQVLMRFEQAAREAGVPYTGQYARAADVDNAIVEAAQEHQCDMIVMVTHGRGAFGELLFGSQTKAVLRRSKLPVLVLH